MPEENKTKTAYQRSYERERESLATEQDAERTWYRCPFQYKRTDPESGIASPSVDMVNKDEYNVRMCGVGKGDWCRICMHYNQHKVTQNAWDQLYRNMGELGRPPKPVAPKRIVDAQERADSIFRSRVRGKPNKRLPPRVLSETMDTQKVFNDAFDFAKRVSMPKKKPGYSYFDGSELKKRFERTEGIES